MHSVSKKEKDTGHIAKKFFLTLRSQKSGATVVALYGNLGTGKTTFVQYFAKNLGIKKKVNSPTFVIMKRYRLKHKNFKNLFHFDAYRLKNEKELLHLGWKEIILDPGHLVFIEWPENIKKALPKKHHKISISHLPTGQAGTKEGHRKFNIKKA